MAVSQKVFSFPKPDPSRILTDTVERLSCANSLSSITGIVAEAARLLTGAEGATFVLREEGKCYYADENAVSPLWKGLRFPAESCVSGWSMKHKEVVVIPDIFKDPRVPVDAYKPTFVRSLCMVPIRAEDPIGAIGNYWSATDHRPTEEDIKLLQVLANSSAVALENLELREAILRRNSEKVDLVDREKELETAIHSLVHDLRNPLTTLYGYADLMQARNAGKLDEKSQGYLESMMATCDRMSQRIEKMLSLYRVTQGGIDKKDIDLSQIATHLVDQLRPRGDRPVEIVIENGLRAQADPQLIQLVLENLISNAFKYSGKKPQVRIQLGASGTTVEEVTFFVRDNGDGFESSQADRLFQPLVRLHHDSDFPGTGLGLASVARIIHMHGGSVRAEGKKSEGATFYFSLPRE